MALYTIKQASEQLGCGHRKLHARLVSEGALQRDSYLPCWRAATPWMRTGLMREKEYQFLNTTTGREQWAVRVLITESGMRKLRECNGSENPAKKENAKPTTRKIPQ